MRHARLLRAALALTFLLASAWFVVHQPPQLGLDLRGGTQIVLETRPTERVDLGRETTDRTVEVLRRRVDALGVAEPTLARAGDRRIIVELPGVQDPRAAAEVIGRTAQLSFHRVLDELATGTAAAGADLVLPDESGATLRLGPSLLRGDGVSGASAQPAQFGTGWTVAVEFSGAGDDAWTTATAEAACSAPGTAPRRMAITLDGEVISSPQVDPSVQCGTGIAGGSTQITGSFTSEEASDLAALIRGGALPVPVEIVEQRVVGPTLGAAAIDASLKAAIIGLALTATFLVLAYRLAGLLAVAGLASFGLLSFGALSAIGATLTLPGLAGLLLSAGLAIDANVLVFERARDELAAGPRRALSRVLARGYRNAWNAIADSNATTLLAAGLLFLLASGPVRGFGVTLTVGVLASMVSALLVSRVLTDTFLTRRTPLRLSGIAGESRVRRRLRIRDPHLMRHRRTWLATSGVLVALAVTGITVRGLDLGVEFTGGRLVEYSTASAVDVDAARAAVSDAGFPKAVVQASGEGDLTVRTGGLSDDQEQLVRAAVASVGGDVDLVRDELIGPSLGDELRTKALIALAVAIGAQLIYLAVRFRWTFAGGAVLAMMQDLLVVVGAFAWTGRTIDGVFLAAALAVIGLSVNDSIVTLDRVRELQHERPDEPFGRICDRAILQTAPRTINTGLGALFILATLLIVGGDSLADFALALLIGLLIGTWSSAFTALPLTALFESRQAQASKSTARRPVSSTT